LLVRGGFGKFIGSNKYSSAFGSFTKMLQMIKMVLIVSKR
jgi:hypothetical protein